MPCLMFYAGDELFSDTYPMKDINGIMYEVEGKVIIQQITRPLTPLLTCNSQLVNGCHL